MTHSSAPRLAILGAGPIGLEAALAAADAELPYTLYEAAPFVAGHVQSWGHVRLFTSWDLDVSPRARRHLAAAGAEPPTGGDCPTGRELAARVLEPMARLRVVAPHLRLATRVVAVSRDGLLKHEEIGTGVRRRHPFRLLLAGDGDREWIERAEVVLDCTGSYTLPSPLGDGGIPAPGERRLGGQIERRIPDLAAEPLAWAGREILLVGGGHSAQTAAVELAELAAEHPETRVHWALRRADGDWPIDDDDPLPERAALTRRARRLANWESSAVAPVFGVTVESLDRRDGRITVTLREAGGGFRRLTVDRVLALTGSVGDHTLYRELQVHECYATSGPMKLAAALLGGSSTDCLDQTSHGAEALTSPEPDFYILGAKSYGRNNTFLMRVGWQQVEEVFAVLGERLAAAS